MNALDFSSTRFLFGKIHDHGEEEHKKIDFALKKIQKVRDKRNTDRIKCLDFFYKMLRERNDGRTSINNDDEAMLKHYQVFSK